MPGSHTVCYERGYVDLASYALSLRRRTPVASISEPPATVHGIRYADFRRVRRYDLKTTEGKTFSQKTKEEVSLLFDSCTIDDGTECRMVGDSRWHPLNELFPLLNYGVPPAFVRRTQTTQESVRNSGLDPDDHGRPSMTTALKAGWICFGLGAAIAWFFPFGHLFYSGAIVLGGMCISTQQRARGLVLVINSCAGIGLSTLIFFRPGSGPVIAASPAPTPKPKSLAEEVKEGKYRGATLQRFVTSGFENIARTPLTPPASPSPRVGSTSAPKPPNMAIPPIPLRSMAEAAKANAPPPKPSLPIEQWSAKELLAEISRLEELQRASRKADGK
jgi:hypothetical protein